jgi:peptidoglycan/LPS O-acetylase OafA/YrhL
MSKAIHYRPDIDGLRAIAIIGVVLFHAFPKAFRGGFVGVDVFFVISGFLITSILLRSEGFKGAWLRDFYYRRAIRILPALTLMVATCAAAGYFLLFQKEYAELGRHMAASGLFIENVNLWKTSGYFDTLTEEKPLMHLWSLAVEEQFYLLYPLLLFVLSKTQRDFRKAILIGIFLSFALSLYALGTDSSAAFYLPQNRFWELFIGGWLAIRNPMASSSRWLSALTSITGFILIIAGFLVIRSDLAFPGFWALLPTFGAAFLIMSGPSAPINALLLSRKGMVQIGLISYPLYLWHWPLLSFERIIDNGTKNVAVTIGLIAASFFLAWATYLWVELPARKRGKRGVPGLVMLLVGLTAVGGTILASGGVPSRGARFAETAVGLETLAEGARGWEEGCQTVAEPSDAEPAIGRCSYYPKGGTSGRYVLVLGDSHASALIKGMDLAQTGFSGASRVYLFDRAGCLPFRDVDLEHSGHRCSEAFNRVYDWMARHANQIDAVILASRWASHYDGTGFSPGEHRHTFVSDRYPEKAGMSLFEWGLRETLSFFKSHQIPVVFVDQVPELDFSPRACFDRPFSFKLRKNPCAIEHASVLRRQSDYRAIVRSLADEGYIPDRLDPLRVLCHDGLCWAKEGEIYRYSDDDHLSREGSRVLLDEIRLHPGVVLGKRRQ